MNIATIQAALMISLVSCLIIPPIIPDKYHCPEYGCQYNPCQNRCR
jgi:hypothetical protein